jgi:hypothetical protein
MYRKTNRAAFLGKPNSSCLAQSYGKLVAIELTIKDVLGSAATSTYQHDVPRLLNDFAEIHAMNTTPIPASALKSKASQLANTLRQLKCSDKWGGIMMVPHNNYPYMRYVLHELDGADPTDSKEEELQRLGQIADDIVTILGRTYQVHA